MASSLPASGHNRPLAEAIAVSTRAVHARLNKLIIARLPLALPPRTTDPAVYLLGLLHIAPIYITFEALWQNILDTPAVEGASDGSSDGCDPSIPLLDKGSILEPRDGEPRIHQPLVCERLHAMLRHLHLPGLMRAQRLRADIKSLTGWPDHIVEDQLRSISQEGRLGEFISHIKRVVEHKPHVLVTYAYIMFMALFAGGRFIRASLESAGEEFWQQTPSQVKSTMPTCDPDIAHRTEPASQMTEEQIASAGRSRHASHALPLRFFHFPTPMDGEDLKREFKNRLADSEDILTRKEQHDIEQEAVCIFENMILLVNQLDGVCADLDLGAGADPNASVESLSGLLKNPLGLRLRDSVAVAKERSAKSSSRMSSSSAESVCSFTAKNRGQSKASEVISAVTAHAGSFSSVASEGSTPHVAIPGIANVELCPGLSKSMRFEKALTRPTRSSQYGSHDGTSDLPGGLKMTASKMPKLHTADWVVMVAFGVMILGALLTSRV